MTHACALRVYLGAKRRYINTLPFLSFLTEAVVIFGNISTAFGTLAVC